MSDFAPPRARSRLSGVLWRARSRLFGPGLERDVGRALAPRGGWPPPVRRALLLHLVAAFGPPRRSRGHQHIGQALEIARALAERGYSVDVVDWSERRSILRETYDLVIDLHPRDPALYDEHLKPGAVRLSYITGSNPSWSNAAERSRLEDLRVRRGVVLAPRRQIPPFPRARFESFDAMLTFAGRTTLRTYDEFQLPPLQRLVNNGYEDLAPTPSDLRDPRCFLFMASAGQVHKGLDLLLETFASRPDLTLIVLSRFRDERDFFEAYRRELTRTPNIRAIGFLDLASSAFRSAQERAGWLILPSCSEAQCGTIPVALSMGIPVVASEACDFDEPEVQRLPDCRLETIRGVVDDLARRPSAEVRARSEASLALARRAYTRADHARSLRAALDAVLGARVGGETVR
jgi:glycosyltransferase involved in cell wall biosynthesis